MTRVHRAFPLASLLFILTVMDARAQNVAQVDGVVGGPECSTGGVVVDVPGLALSLKTTGNPVLIMYTVQFNANPTGGITLWPVIDGVTQSSGQRDRLVGTGQVADVTFSRIYEIERGEHTFG